MAIHLCDICGKSAKVLMWEGMDERTDVWYCFECADDYEAAERLENDSEVCPECDNLGGNRYDDGATRCPLCLRW